MPIALISLADEDKQWFKSNVGLPGVVQTPRDYSFCTHAIMTENVLEIADATQESRFANCPLVTGDPNIRFYAGAPITLSMGESIGTICVIDRKAGQLNKYQRKTLVGLACIVRKALVARHETVARQN